MGLIPYLLSFLTPGSFLYVDLFAAATNALNGALLAQRSDHYKRGMFTVVGILVMAIFGGIGGGTTRDILLNEVPGSWTNPWYLILIILAWIIGLLIAFRKGQQFRETTFQIFTAFSLPWYAVVGVEKGLQAGWPFLGAIALGVVGPTAGRFLIDVSSGLPAKQLVQGEWFIGTAILTSISFFLLRAGAMGGFGLALGFIPATLIAFVIGFAFRMAAIWFAWEEPMPRVPAEWLKALPKRETLKEKMQPGWEPKEE
jgi:uncharacterized membrane protein YeiH